MDSLPLHHHHAPCHEYVHWLHHRCYMDEQKKCAVSLANQLRAVADVFRPLRTHSATEHLSGELHKSEILLIFGTLLVVKAEICTGAQPKCTKQSLAFKKLLETLLLTMKMCTGFTADIMHI